MTYKQPACPPGRCAPGGLSPSFDGDATDDLRSSPAARRGSNGTMTVSSPPGPTLPRRVSSPELVGRVEQLTALVDALETASQGHFAAVFVAGESGVGKSRLLHALELAATARGAHVLQGECVPMAEGELPYAPIRSALRPLGSA